jgi:hypothetical protein
MRPLAARRSEAWNQRNARRKNKPHSVCNKWKIKELNAKSIARKKAVKL